MATEIGELFRGVVYHIGTCTDGGDLIGLLLERNGATEASTPKVATRIITDHEHFLIFQDMGCTAFMVTVRLSWRKGLLFMLIVVVRRSGCTAL
jgi:hypothetical protein